MEIKQEGGVEGSVFIRDTVPVIGCEAGSRRTNGQIWGANKSEYGTALMGKSGTKMIMRL